jgi:hypothetical protein
LFVFSAGTDNIAGEAGTAAAGTAFFPPGAGAGAAGTGASAGAALPKQIKSILKNQS